MTGNDGQVTNDHQWREQAANQLPAELSWRLRVLDAYVVLELHDPADAVWMACDVLAAGIDTPSTIELAGESVKTLRSADARRLAQAMLAELGHPAASQEQAIWLAAGDIARRVTDGQTTPETGAHKLLGLMAEHGDPVFLDRLRYLLDAWEDLPPGLRDEDELRADMRNIATEIGTAALHRIDTERSQASRSKPVGSDEPTGRSTLTDRNGPSGSR